MYERNNIWECKTIKIYTLKLNTNVDKAFLGWLVTSDAAFNCKVFFQFFTPTTNNQNVGYQEAIAKAVKLSKIQFLMFPICLSK